MNFSLAIDIGSHYIKVAEGYLKKGRIVLRTAGITRNPFPDAHLNLNENDQKKFVNFLKDFLRKVNIKSRDTVCCVSGNGLIVHYFDIPDIPENEIKNAVELEAIQVIPGGIEKLEYDYAILPSPSPKNRTIMFIGYPKIKCDFFVNTLIMSGLRPIIMDVAGLSLSNCYENLSKNNSKNVAIIDTGAKQTNLAIINSEGFVFIRQIDFGGDTVNAEISRVKNISRYDAEQFKKNPEHEEEVKKILKNVISDTLQEIQTSIRYFETRTQKKIEKFLLTGGSSLLPDFVEIVEENLKIQGEIWKPMAGLIEHCYTSEPQCTEVCFSQILGLISRKLL